MKRFLLLSLVMLAALTTIGTLAFTTRRDPSELASTLSQSLPAEHFDPAPRPTRVARANRSSRRASPTPRTRRPSAPAVGGGTLGSLIEQARANAGLRLLIANGTLASDARQHSAEMARADRIYHTSRTRLASDARRACSCLLNGEIVGIGTSIRRVFDAFMADASHRAVILSSDLRYFGVGIVYSRNVYWVTVRFAG